MIVGNKVIVTCSLSHPRTDSLVEQNTHKCLLFHSAGNGEGEVYLPSIWLATGDAIVTTVKPSDLNLGKHYYKEGGLAEGEEITTVSTWKCVRVNIIKGLCF